MILTNRGSPLRSLLLLIRTQTGVLLIILWFHNKLLWVSECQHFHGCDPAPDHTASSLTWVMTPALNGTSRSAYHDKLIISLSAYLYCNRRKFLPPNLAMLYLISYFHHSFLLVCITQNPYLKRHKTLQLTCLASSSITSFPSSGVPCLIFILYTHKSTPFSWKYFIIFVCFY